MKNILLIWAILLCVQVNAQNKVVVCTDKNGCREGVLNISNAQVDELLQKQNFFKNAQPGDILVLNKCASEKESRLSVQELHQKFGGTGAPSGLASFNLRTYLSENGCVLCPNPIKKITYYIQSEEGGGNGYFFMNLNKGEAFMPDEAYKMMHREMDGMTINSFFRDYQYISYVIDPEGKKWQMSMPIGTSVVNLKNDDWNSEYFKKNFKQTNERKPFLNTGRETVKYTGPCDMGQCSFWLVPSDDVCLRAGKFDAVAFWNLGYLNVDGVTYIVTEISGSGFLVKITGYANGSYNFNSSGYTPVGN